MTRRRALALRAADQRWRSAPMPGANADLDLVPLESDGAGFTILGRFPAGFRRTVPGGYPAAEDVVVLDGRLELEDRAYERGTLVHLPSRFLRTSMHSPDGCLVLAWFSGPAVFRSAAELEPVVTTGVRSVDLSAPDDGVLLETAASRWSVVAAADWPGGADGVDVDRTAWARSVADWPGDPPQRLLVREVR